MIRTCRTAILIFSIVPNFKGFWYLWVSWDTKLTSIHFNGRVRNKLLDMDPFCPSSLSNILPHFLPMGQGILSHWSPMSQSFVSYLCWWFRSYLDVMVAVPKNVTWQLLSVWVFPAKVEFYTSVVNSCRVSYENSDSHQMCTISLKCCSVIATVFFKCLCHFLWHFNSFRGFQYWKIALAYFWDQNNCYFKFLMKKKTVLNWWSFIITMIRS